LIIKVSIQTFFLSLRIDLQNLNPGQMGDLKNKFQDLELRIQNLINSHQNLRKEISMLREENARLLRVAAEEKERMNMMQQGFEEFRDVARVKTRAQISGLKTKVNDMINEIDRSVALIDTNHKQ
jgi:predicted  nucleic acid-binding Zn-ribbon protein